MPIVGQLTALIPGGVLSISDSGFFYDDLVAGPHPLLEVGPAQIIIRVQNGAADGETTIRIASTAIEDPVGPAIFDGTVRIASGRLRVGDAVEGEELWVQVPNGELRVRLHVDDADPDSYPPERVDIVLPDL